MERVWLIAGALSVGGLLGAACGASGPPAEDGGRDARADVDAELVRCGDGDDPDEDVISSLDEGEGDADGDGEPNAADPDADGDGIRDAVEAGDDDCLTAPHDSDRDGVPDFLDRDANQDGVDDAEQRSDADHDGVDDWRELDVDGDGIPNAIEFGDGPTPGDADGDGIPNLRDDDSDGDSILDAHEGSRDSDGDGDPNFLDEDADGDGVADAVEAGDGDSETPPAVCANEVNPITGDLEADGYPDYVDVDRDNDGLSDGQELDIGTDPCALDSDNDGLDDLAEGAYEQVNCPDGSGGVDCGCATLSTCGIPEEHFFVVLPYGGDPVERDLEFGTTIRVADVFFVTDTTGSMSGIVTNVKSTVTTPVTGLIDRIRETIPDAWFGGGQHDDFPFGSYGGGLDEAFKLAIGMTPPTSAAAVQTAFNGIGMHGGADGPESQTEALYQIVTGEGGTWTASGGTPYTMPRYVDACLDSGWGAPCFREAALPIVVHFTDICAHAGPPGESSSCAFYTGISPTPHTWTDMIDAMTTRGAKYVGVNSSGSSCAGVTGPSSYSPCFFMLETAEATGSVDLDGRPLVYDLPSSGGTSTVFTDTIVSAIETIATRVPLDVDTALRDDPSDPDGVDARGFVKRRQPACRATPPSTPCWDAPAGTEHEQAVAFVDDSTFFAAIPGTRVRFRITFQNDFQPGSATARVYIAFIDVRGGGSAVLDTRQVYIVVPASTAGLPI